jgi:hypothetical protein
LFVVVCCLLWLLPVVAVVGCWLLVVGLLFWIGLLYVGCFVELFPAIFVILHTWRMMENACISSGILMMGGDGG